MADKKVTLEVAIEADDSAIDNVERELQKVKNEKIRMQIEADTAKLQEAQGKVDSLKSELSGLVSRAYELNVPVDTSKVNALQDEINHLDGEIINLQTNVDNNQAKLEINEVEDELNDLNNNEIEVNLQNQSAMLAIDQISQGFDRLKAGAGELASQFSELLASAGKQETNLAYLTNAVGDAQKAKNVMSEINQIVQDLPGDDTALQGLLSSAAAKDSSLSANNLRSMASSAADYMSAMSFYGKTATETQQDLTNYLLAGNVAEIERSPILSSHIDKLKEATNLQERSEALAEALNEEGWHGMSNQDTYNNKLETFNGMLERGKYTLGGMFQEAAKGGMDFLLKLDDITGGWVGMGIAAAQMLSPLTDVVAGIGQMATGIKAIKGLNIIKHLKDLELAEKASAAAQWLLNAAMSANPITIVVLAIAALIAILTYLYYTNEDVRKAIDAIFDALSPLVDFIVSDVTTTFNNLVLAWNLVSEAFQNGANFISETLGGAFTWLQETFNNLVDFFNTYGPLIAEVLFVMSTGGIGAIVLLIANFLGMPNQIGQALTNVINRVTTFCSNLVSKIVNGAQNAVNGFINKIKEMPTKFKQELDKMINDAINFAQQLPGIIAKAASSMVSSWVGGSGEHSPGFMYNALIGEITEMEDAASDFNIAAIMGGHANAMVDSWNANNTFDSPHIDEVVQNRDGNLEALLNRILDALNTKRDEQVTFNFTLNGDMDSEERMEKFIDEVNRRFFWNNSTAGRTV